MIYFIHIPKTGGTSLHRALDRSVMTVSPLIKRRDIRRWAGEGNYLEELSGCDVIMGHFRYDEISSLIQPADKVITWVREPISRVISNYHFFISGLENPQRNPEQYRINQHRKNETLLEYAQREENRNRISEFLNGADIRQIDFIGTIEFMDSDLERLSRFLGVDIDPPPVLNKGNRHTRVISAEEKGILADLNAEDMGLYQRILEMNRYGLV